MAKYKECWESPIDSTLKGYFDNDSGINIPISANNVDYQSVMAWIDEGNTPDPAYTQTEIDAYQATIDRQEDIQDAQNATGMSGLTVDEAKQIITDRIDIVRVLPESNLAEIQAKIAELCDQTEWLFKKVAVFLLK